MGKMMQKVRSMFNKPKNQKVLIVEENHPKVKNLDAPEITVHREYQNQKKADYEKGVKANEAAKKSRIIKAWNENKLGVK